MNANFIYEVDGELANLAADPVCFALEEARDSAEMEAIVTGVSRIPEGKHLRVTVEVISELTDPLVSSLDVPPVTED